MIEMAHDVAAEADRGASFEPPLSADELVFYDAVSSRESAVNVQGSDVLANIAREVVAVMRRDVKTDWTVRHDVRAKLRSPIKRLLVSHNYPQISSPDQSAWSSSRWRRWHPVRRMTAALGTKRDETPAPAWCWRPPDWHHVILTGTVELDGLQRTPDV